MKKINGLETPEYRRPIPAPMPVASSSHITIPVAEYIYLQRVDALMDALLNADNYNNAQVVASVRNTIKAMRCAGEAGAEL